MRGRLEALAPHVWELRAGDKPVAPRDASVEMVAGDNVSFRITWPRPARAETVTLRSTQIGHFSPGHRQFVVIADERGSPARKKLLSAKDDTLELKLTPANAAISPAAEAPPTFWGFVRLGVEHIWTGYDH